jgi:Family of unknown function (DUF5677)
MSTESGADRQVTFGFEDFWPIAHKEYENQFGAISALVSFTDRMLQVAEKKAADPVEKVVYALTRITVIGMNDVVLLCGNGCGTAAMKIVRGMFESSTTAEYLRRNPEDVEDYISFGRILAWRRYRWVSTNRPEDAKRVSLESVNKIEDEYNRVRGRFTDSSGRVRNQWSAKPFGNMAEELGRRDEYDLVFGLGSSIHHANAEGLSAGITVENGEIIFDTPPSEAWLTAAPIAGHTNLLSALRTLDESCKLDYSRALTKEEQDFRKVWGSIQPSLPIAER